MEEKLLIELETILKAHLNTYIAFMETVRAPTIDLGNVLDHNIKVGEEVLVDEFPTVKLYFPADTKRTDQLVHNLNDEIEHTYRAYVDVFIQDDSPRNTILRLMRYKEALREVLKQYSTLSSIAIGSIITGTYNTNLFRRGTNLHQGARIEVDILAFDTDQTVKVE